MNNNSIRLINKLIRKSVNFLYLICFWLLWVFIRLLTIIFQVFKIDSLTQMRLKGMHSVIFLEPIFPNNAGYYYRCQLWAEKLRNKGFKVKITFVFDEQLHGELHSGKISQPFYHFLFLIRQFFRCLKAFNYNLIIVRRELLLFNDYGNLFLEKFLLSINKNVVLDFDDDISAAKNEPRKISFYGKLMLEHPTKFQSSLRLYKYFIVGSDYLKQLVNQYSPASNPKKINVIPTCVNYEMFPLKEYSTTKEYIDFGWIGNSWNFFYLDELLDALNLLSLQYKIRLIIISDLVFSRKVNFEIINYSWSLDRDIELLQKIDVGLMPLNDSAVSKGKCGFKLIQYMGSGLVSISSAVTITNEIVDNNENGFLVFNKNDWQKILFNVVEQRIHFSDIGKKAHEKILRHYSFNANENKYIDFLMAIINKQL